MSYYIINPDAHIYNVWMRNPGKGKNGCFVRDFDAAYNKKFFAYKSIKNAVMVANRIKAKHNLDSIEVVDRKGLFNALGVDDWSHGY